MKVAIFNSFPFHYETFGYILHFVKQNNYQLTIYTNQSDPLGWLTILFKLKSVSKCFI